MRWISYPFTYESLTTPEATYDSDLRSGVRRLAWQQQVPGGFRQDDYASRRVWVTAREGVQVPVSIVCRNGVELGGSNPLLLYGYGSYGISIEPDFDSDLFSLLDRGFVYAIGHIRDGSAGGLLMGAVINQAPELFNGVATRVAFVDLVTAMLDESIPLATGELDEWGDPRDRPAFDYMLSHSPYDNVVAQDYPHLLVTTGLHDSKESPARPAVVVTPQCIY